MGFEIFGILLIILFAALLIVGVILLVITRNPNNAGSRCTGNSDCTGGAICEMSSNTCRIPTGGTCLSNAQCATGDACASNICVRVTTTEQVAIANKNLSTPSTSLRGRAVPTRSTRSIVNSELATGDQGILKQGRSLNNVGIQSRQDDSLVGNSLGFDCDGNQDMLDGSVILDKSPKVKFTDTMVHGPELSEARQRWKAKPVLARPDRWTSRNALRNGSLRDSNVSTSSWKAEPVEAQIIPEVITSEVSIVPRDRSTKGRDVNRWRADPVSDVSFSDDLDSTCDMVRDRNADTWNPNPGPERNVDSDVVSDRNEVSDRNMVRNSNVSRWRVGPNMNIDSRDVDGRNVNRWKVESKTESGSKEWNARATEWNARATRQVDVNTNLIDLDFEVSEAVESVPTFLDSTSWLESTSTSTSQSTSQVLTQTDKLRSQFVDEVPTLEVEPRKVITHNRGLRVPVQETEVEDDDDDEEYLYGTFRDSSVRGVTVTSEGRPVLDLCHFSSYIIYLHEGGYATRETINKEQSANTEKVPVKMNIKPTSLAKHRGNLYSLQNGRLYMIDISTLTTGIWKWNPCSWSPLNILYMSATTDGKHLYLQTSEYDILYDSSLNEVSRTQYQGVRRVYGYDLQTYIDIDIDSSTGVYHAGTKQEILTDLVDAIILHNGKVVSISTADSSLYSRIRLIQWRPWYIKRNVV